MLFENVGLATSLESFPPAGVSYLKEKRATMSSSKERKKSSPQAYSCCVPESESRAFTNGVCEPWKVDEAEQFYLPFLPSHLWGKTTHQVQREDLHAFWTKDHFQQLLGHCAQHQQGQHGQRNTEAQQGQEAALTAGPSVGAAGQPVGEESQDSSLKDIIRPFSTFDQGQ